MQWHLRLVVVVDNVQVVGSTNGGDAGAAAQTLILSLDILLSCIALNRPPTLGCSDCLVTVGELLPLFWSVAGTQVACRSLAEQGGLKVSTYIGGSPRRGRRQLAAAETDKMLGGALLWCPLISLAACGRRNVPF